MQRCFTKALWLTETIAASLGARRLAMSLATSLAKLCIRLIRRKYFTSIASCFLGSRVMKAVFNSLSLDKLPCCTASKARMTSSWMTID
uniref:Uncharacterized protein n=1 Tax=Arundo donax TaxID=35708 RepID=A0A0A9HMI0_ARUDO